MADYPDWVLKHKDKGTYVNKVGDKYYLYAAHSERVKGTRKVRRVCDGYLGRITEKDGLVPPKEKVRDTVFTYEFGLSHAVLCTCKNIHAGLRKSFVKHGDFIMVASVLNYIHGMYSTELFYCSHLSLRFKNVSFLTDLTDAQVLGIGRGTRMIADTMIRTMPDDLEAARAYLPTVQVVRINNKLYLSNISRTAKELADKYSIVMGVEAWLK